MTRRRALFTTASMAVAAVLLSSLTFDLFLRKQLRRLAFENAGLTLELVHSDNIKKIFRHNENIHFYRLLNGGERKYRGIICTLPRVGPSFPPSPIILTHRLCYSTRGKHLDSKRRVQVSFKVVDRTNVCTSNVKGDLERELKNMAFHVHVTSDEQGVKLLLPFLEDALRNHFLSLCLSTYLCLSTIKLRSNYAENLIKK